MFKIEGSLNRSAFISLAKQLGKDVAIFDNKFIDEVVIDLSAITFADPFGIIGLIIFTRHIFNTFNLKSRIILPLNPEAKSYLLNAGITIDKNTITTFPETDYSIQFRYWLNNLSMIKESNTNGNFIPITSIIKSSDIDIINNSVDKWMTSNNYDDEERYDVQVLISELCQNIMQHSHTIQDGMFLMQGYTRRRDNMKYCTISIGDTGIGIKNSLSQKPDYKDLLSDDVRAIRYAFNEGWSSKENERFRGNGFSNLKRLSLKYNLNVCIHSHGGFIGYIYPEISTNKRIINTDSFCPVYGTQVNFGLKSKL